MDDWKAWDEAQAQRIEDREYVKSLINEIIGEGAAERNRRKKMDEQKDRDIAAELYILRENINSLIYLLWYIVNNNSQIPLHFKSPSELLEWCRNSERTMAEKSTKTVTQKSDWAPRSLI